SGSGLLTSSTKSTRQRSWPVFATRQTRTSRMPATYKHSPSYAGVERIQSPLDLAKNGTEIAPGHSRLQGILPVRRSNAETTSISLFLDSVVNTNSSETMGPE